MKVGLQWTADAQKDLQNIGGPIADRIIRKVVWFAEQANPLRHAEPLTGTYQGISRFRVGEYRVLFEKDAQEKIFILMVLRVKHRRDVYR